jgi:transposase
MLLETLLRHVQPVKGFVYESARLIEDPVVRDAGRIVVRIRARKGRTAVCSGCGQRRPVHDTLGERRFDFVPLWGLAVVFCYVMRRVRCKRCGVRVEWVPWIRPASKSPMTIAMEQFLATWAKRLSWQEVARVFHVSWDRVFSAVKAAVDYGLAHRDLTGITAIGVDELSRRRGQVYATLVYQIDRGRKRLLFMSADRKESSLRAFCDAMGTEVCAQIQFVCSDMWKPYLNVIRERLGQAVHVLDRFHIMANLSKAIDEVRAEEARRLAAAGKPVLKGTRWLFLKRMTNLNRKQAGMLSELLKLNLRTARAWALKEALNVMWTYKHPAWAGRFFDRWCAAVMRSRLEPMKRVARSLRDHRTLLLNWFRAKGEISAATAEGKNHRAKVRTRMAYGYRTFEVMQVALYHELGDLPEPPALHRFA